VSAPAEKSLVTDSGSRIIRSKVILLEISDSFQSQSNSINNNACNIPAGPKGMLRILLDVWRIQDYHGQRNNPNPDHLEYPKGKELEEVISLVVEPVVFAGLKNTEEQKSREPKAPDHNEEGYNDLARIMVAAECKSDNG